MRVLVNTGGRRLRSGLGRAEKWGAAFEVVRGEAERARGLVQVKALRAGLADSEVAVSQLPAKLKSLLAH